MLIGGLDVGTTGCKLTVYSGRGEFIHNEYVEYEVTRHNGEHEIDKVLCILPDGSNGAPCGACRELMVQLMAGKYYDIEIMLDYSTGRTVKLGEITPEWWIK